MPSLRDFLSSLAAPQDAPESGGIHGVTGGFSVKRGGEQGDWQIPTKWKLGRIGVKSKEVIYIIWSLKIREPPKIHWF